MGKVLIVGAGTGRCDYITVRGMECIKEADVIVYDHLSGAAFFGYAKQDCQFIYAGKRRKNHHLKQAEIHTLLYQLSEQYETVVRLKGGDPFVFGRGGEEALFLKEHGIDYEVVPGISSSYAAALSCGIPVTHRTMASSFHVITGHEQKGENRINYEVLAKNEGTLIFLMGLHCIEQIAENLMQYGKSQETPCAVISCGTTEHETCVTGKLCEIARLVKEKNIISPAIILVGEVATLHSQIGREKKYHKNILVTGSESVFADMKKALKPYDIVPIGMSLIKTEPIQFEAFSKIDFSQFTYLVLSSKEGVRIFFDYLRKTKQDIRTISHIRFAVVGKYTAKALEGYGIFADIIPDSYDSKGLAKEMQGTLQASDKVLLLRAKKHSTIVDEMLEKEKIPFESISIYQTVTDMRKKELLEVFEPEMDEIVFASGSAAKAYQEMTNGESHARYISIGENCTKTAEKYGLKINQTAKQHSSEGICACILEEE